MLEAIKKHKIEFHFLEPKIVINKYSYCLDIDVEGQEFNVELPVGAINDVETFENKVKLALTRTAKILKLIDVHIDRKSFKVYKLIFVYAYA